MSLAVPPQNLARRRKAAVFLLLAAAAAWGFVLLIQLPNSSAQRHIEAGMELAQSGKGVKAEREWREAARLAPKNAQAWELLGEYYLSADRFVSALDAFRHLERLQPETPQLYARLAIAAFKTGDEVAAYDYAEAELRRSPEDVTALALAATLLAGMGEETKRLTYLRRLVELAPDDLDFQIMLAKALTFKPRYEEAILVLDGILQRAPDNAEAASLRGMCRLNSDPSAQGQAQAEADFLRAIQINARLSFPRLYLGRLYRKQRKHEKAIHQLQTAAQLSPDMGSVYFEIAAIYDQAGQPNKAAPARERFAAIKREEERIFSLEQRSVASPENFDYKLELGKIYLQKGDLRKAGSYLNKARTLRPDDAEVRLAFEELTRQLANASQSETLRDEMNVSAPK